MYKRYKTKKLLPPIIKTLVPSQSLRQRLYSEEVFDCIKKNIFAQAPTQTLDERTEAILDSKRRRETRIEIKKRFLEKYSEAELDALIPKKVRRLQKPNLTPVEWLVLCEIITARRGTKTLKRWERRKAKLLKRRTKEKKGIKRTTYNIYISSEAWYQRRNLFWQLHPKRCSVCDTAKKIHLHHMHYGQFGNEPDEHLIPLCEKHHNQYHKENGTQRNMIKTTLAFVETHRG